MTVWAKLLQLAKVRRASDPRRYRWQTGDLIILEDEIAVAKYNAYHDARGRFTANPSGAVSPADAHAMAQGLKAQSFKEFKGQVDRRIHDWWWDQGRHQAHLDELPLELDEEWGDRRPTVRRRGWQFGRALRLQQPALLAKAKFEETAHPRHPKGSDKGGQFMAKDAATVLGTKLAGPGGSNPGGVYQGTDQVKRYVKFYSDPAQAYGEHLANQVYADLGLGALTSHVFPSKGKITYASDLLQGHWTQLGSGHLTPDVANKVLDGYAADVLTANWDAVGLVHDNVLVSDTGQVVRVDNGGAFLMRAKAGRKPEAILDQITELEGFGNPKVNPAYAKVMQVAGVTPVSLRPRLQEQVKQISAMVDKAGGWPAYVARTVPGMPATDQARIIQMLTARLSRLRHVTGLVSKEKPSFNEDEHPRYPPNSPGGKGGQFAPKGAVPPGFVRMKGSEDPADHDTTVMWRWGGTGGPVTLNDVPFTPWVDAPTTIAGWAKVEGQLPEDPGGPFQLPPAKTFTWTDKKTGELKTSTSQKHASAGVIIKEPDGRVWLVEPLNHYGGYEHTFPKGTQDEGLGLQATAIKEAYEETGLKVRITGHALDLERDSSMARYYWAERVGGEPAAHGGETYAVKLVPVKYLNTLLNRRHDQDIAVTLGAPKPKAKKTEWAQGGGQTSLWGSGPSKHSGKKKPLTELHDDTLPAPKHGSGMSAKQMGWLPEWMRRYVVKAEFEESQHPRYPAGTPGGLGGQFMPTGDVSTVPGAVPFMPLDKLLETSADLAKIKSLNPSGDTAVSQEALAALLADLQGQTPASALTMIQHVTHDWQGVLTPTDRLALWQLELAAQVQAGKNAGVPPEQWITPPLPQGMAPVDELTAALPTPVSWAGKASDWEHDPAVYNSVATPIAPANDLVTLSPVPPSFNALVDADPADPTTWPQGLQDVVLASKTALGGNMYALNKGYNPKFLWGVATELDGLPLGEAMDKLQGIRDTAGNLTPREDAFLEELHGRMITAGLQAADNVDTEHMPLVWRADLAAAVPAPPSPTVTGDLAFIGHVRDYVNSKMAAGAWSIDSLEQVSDTLGQHLPVNSPLAVTMDQVTSGATWDVATNQKGLVSALQTQWAMMPPTVREERLTAWAKALGHEELLSNNTYVPMWIHGSDHPPLGLVQAASLMGSSDATEVMRQVYANVNPATLSEPAQEFFVLAGWTPTASATASPSFTQAKSYFQAGWTVGATGQAVSPDNLVAAYGVPLTSSVPAPVDAPSPTPVTSGLTSSAAIDTAAGVSATQQTPADLGYQKATKVHSTTFGGQTKWVANAAAPKEPLTPLSKNQKYMQWVGGKLQALTLASETAAGHNTAAVKLQAISVPKSMPPIVEQYRKALIAFHVQQAEQQAAAGFGPVNYQDELSQIASGKYLQVGPAKLTVADAISTVKGMKAPWGSTTELKQALKSSKAFGHLSLAEMDQVVDTVMPAPPFPKAPTLKGTSASAQWAKNKINELTVAALSGNAEAVKQVAMPKSAYQWKSIGEYRENLINHLMKYPGAPKTGPSSPIAAQTIQPSVSPNAGIASTVAGMGAKSPGKPLPPLPPPPQVDASGKYKPEDIELFHKKVKMLQDAALSANPFVEIDKVPAGSTALSGYKAKLLEFIEQHMPVPDAYVGQTVSSYKIIEDVGITGQPPAFPSRSPGEFSADAKYRSSLPHEQQSALTWYQGSGYSAANKHRFNPGIPLPAQAKSLDKALAGNVLKHDTLLTRKISSKALAQLAPSLAGKIIEDPAYQSTSISSNAWSGNVTLKINAPAGTRGLFMSTYNYQGEQEFLMPRNTRMQVHHVHKAPGNQVTIYLTVLPPELQPSIPGIT